jgi:hypothetical protein
MKTRLYILILMLSMVMSAGFSQDKTRRELKEISKLEKQKQIEAMINAREFVFVPRTAIPAGMEPVDLSSNRNYIKFQPYIVDSYMPFFGRAYSGIGYGADTGLSFKGSTEKFDIEKKEKNFQIDVVVKGESDNFYLHLSVAFEGNTSLSISSNNRSTISFQGEITVPESTENK